MNLAKAKEELKDALTDKWCPWSPDLKDAIKLGIEALEFLSQWERDHNGAKLVVLPGETTGG